MLRKVAAKGVEMADAGRYSSRRRASTAGSEDPLPIARLPERFRPEPASAESSESRSVSKAHLLTIRVAYRLFALASRVARRVYPKRRWLAGAGPCFVPHSPSRTSAASDSPDRPTFQ